MNSYISWGTTNLNISNQTGFVFINAFGEFIGMFIFMLLLICTIMNFSLEKSKGYNKRGFGWIVLGIAFGLLVGLLAATGIQTGLIKTIYNGNQIVECSNLASINLNPIFVISGMLKGSNCSSGYIPVGNGFIILIFEFLGSSIAALVSYLFFKRLILVQSDITSLRTCFYTKPSIFNWKANIFNEFIATFVLCIAIIGLGFLFEPNQIVLKLIVIGLIVGSIGYGLGGTTGYALNPFRDLCPRIVYTLIFKKKDQTLMEDWKYSLVPIFAPIIASIIATIIMPGFLY